MGRRSLMREEAKRGESRTWVERHEENVREWNDAIARTIRCAIRSTTIKAFSDRIHYARTTMATLLSQSGKSKQRAWTFDTLVAVSEGLGCSLSELILAAEQIKGKPDAEPTLAIRLTGLQPHSKERLQHIIFEAAGYSGDVDKKKYDGLLEVVYRVDNFEYGCKDFCTAYYKGELSDGGALRWLTKAAQSDLRLSDGEPLPLWAALKEIYRP